MNVCATVTKHLNTWQELETRIIVKIILDIIQLVCQSEEERVAPGGSTAQTRARSGALGGER